MEQKRKFKNRSEAMDYYAKQHGWKPLTEEEERELYECLKTITNFKPHIVKKYENHN